jgi:excisionase family DNA binding protein
MQKQLLTTREVAEMLGFSPATITHWRARPPKKALPYLKLGGRVRYRRADVEAYLAEALVEPEVES